MSAPDMPAPFVKAIVWIAENDEPTCLDVDQVSDMISVALIADIFHKPAVIVAQLVVGLRKRTKAA